eukprot:TRINITY_DN75892_c0_g1_i1.p1 TRINITY_DN75892_c0_g1~~TRINITY_DN75892_c0_g1_i1.p1  ORF type:complete len:385 (-),score=105.35 TRINITY_DN75892_c0_g1_i1:142-1296(-)
MAHTRLQQAAYSGDANAVRECLQQGDSVNERGSAGGWTPLHVAAGNGHVAAVEALLAAGAEPLGLDGDGRSALDWADWSGHAAVQLVLRRQVRLQELLEVDRKVPPWQPDAPRANLLNAEARIAELGRELAERENVAYQGSVSQPTVVKITAPLMGQGGETQLQRLKEELQKANASEADMASRVCVLTQELLAMHAASAEFRSSEVNDTADAERLSELTLEVSTLQAATASQTTLVERQQIEMAELQAASRQASQRLAIFHSEFENCRLELHEQQARQRQQQEQHEQQRSGQEAQQIRWQQDREEHLEQKVAEVRRGAEESLQQQIKQRDVALEELRTSLHENEADAKTLRESCRQLHEEMAEAKENEKKALDRAAAASRAFGR